MKTDIREKIFKSGIVFIAPQYKDGVGDTTLICTGDDYICIEKNIKTVIKNLAKYIFLDLDESMSYHKDLLGKARNLPIVLDDNVLFCVKTRIPIGKNDGAMTYVNYKRIKDYDYGIVELDNGDSIYTHTSKEAVRRNLRDCKLIVSSDNFKRYRDRYKEVV